MVLLIEDTVPDPKLGIGERIQSNIRVDCLEHWCVLHTIKFEMRLKKGKCLDASAASGSSLEEAEPELDLRWSGATPTRYIYTRLQEGPFASCHCWPHHVLPWTFFSLSFGMENHSGKTSLFRSPYFCVALGMQTSSLKTISPVTCVLKWSLKCSDGLFHLQGPRRVQKQNVFVWIRLLWVVSTPHRHCPPGLLRMAQLWQESSQTWDIFVFFISKYHSGI